MPHPTSTHTTTPVQAIASQIMWEGVSANIPNPPGRHPYGFGHRPVSVLEGHGNLTTIQLSRDVPQQANKYAVFNLDSEFEQFLKGVADAARRATQCFGFCEVNPFHATSMEQPDDTFSPSTHPKQFTSEEAA